ncbi:MAG: hypothetical protein IJX85_11680 [Lachnospiraceae bacterium]|nr:hypothetical protein [Lachnospiraceae bacterium]MBQ8318986.1 hypothetical protein [Lachnospiraceae bacterium]
MKRKIMCLFIGILLICTCGCGSNDADVIENVTAENNDVNYNNENITIDYENAELYETALNEGRETIGNIVKFEVVEYHPGSIAGYNAWAGEHLNFISQEDVMLKSDDVVTGRVVSVKQEIGSWFIEYELICVNEEIEVIEVVQEIEDEDEVEELDSVENITTSDTVVTENAQVITEEEEFIEAFKEYQSEAVASEVYNIYATELGFENIEFKGTLDSTLNYEIIANGYNTVVTVIEEGDYRIFIPSSPFVLYEDGCVQTSCAELEDQTIDSYDMQSYYIIAKTIVEDNLKNPKSADFPSTEEISYQKKGNLVALKGYVYAENSFGATVKSDWVVQFYVNDLGMFDYTVQYVELDGSSSGEFISYE